MQRERAEQRAAPPAQRAAPPSARPGELIAEAVRARLAPCRQTVLLRLLGAASTGSPREAIARGMWRWRAAAVALAASDATQAPRRKRQRRRQPGEELAALSGQGERGAR